MTRTVVALALLVACLLALGCGSASSSAPAGGSADAAADTIASLPDATSTTDGQAAPDVDAGTGTDATPGTTQLPEGGAACPADAGAPVATACHNDGPPPGVTFIQGGYPCTLADGGVGVGAGGYGCIPRGCICRPEGGCVACVDGGGHSQIGSLLELWRDGHCVYASCNREIEGEACASPGGGEGSCCQGRCVDVGLFQTDTNNCGGCGLGCPTGVACVQGNCGSSGPSDCTGASCPAGRVCAGVFSLGGSADQCVAESCSSEPDGTPCPNPTDGGVGYYAGMCCNHACVDPLSDPHNCGSCGIECCAGTTCHGICD